LSPPRVFISWLEREEEEAERVTKLVCSVKKMFGSKMGVGEERKEREDIQTLLPEGRPEDAIVSMLAALQVVVGLVPPEENLV
jgi:hypothetical protein